MYPGLIFPLPEFFHLLSFRQDIRLPDWQENLYNAQVLDDRRFLLLFLPESDLRLHRGCLLLDWMLPDLSLIHI